MKFYKLTRLVLFATLFFTLSACASKTTITPPVPLVGEVNAETLLSDYPLFQKAYQDYDVSGDEQTLAAQLPEGLTIKVYFGTWCHDSQREVARLLKLFNTSSIKQPHVDVWLYALDYHKSDKLGLAKKAQITHTPTFVVYQQNNEIGRIVERPSAANLAQELTQIVN